MTDKKSLIHFLNKAPDLHTPWAGDYKIPWNEPEFSRRMLNEHLAQEHDLASRRSEIIALQASWIIEHALCGRTGSVLDLGCGPGLYAPRFASHGCQYLGIDFGPASIEYANAHYSVDGQVSFRLDDVRSAELGNGYDVVLMLYGELNVFSPEACADIVERACKSLKPGGKMVIEGYTRETVVSLGQGQGWYACENGLFAETPHICLIQNHWLEELNVSVQEFKVVEMDTGALNQCRSTTQAYSNEEYSTLFAQAGFVNSFVHDTWPGNPEHHVLFMAEKAG